MPVGKRSTKVISYKEQDDDDDFISMADDNTKNNRRIKSSNDLSKILKSSTKEASRKHDEKSYESEQEELKMMSSCSEKSPIENPMMMDKKENTDIQSTTLNNKTLSENLVNITNQDENQSPKSKRMKQDEKDENEFENQDKDKLDDEHSIFSENLICKAEEIFNKTKISTTRLSMNYCTSRTNYHDISTRTLDHSKKRSSVPLGFPTSKINIPSPHAFRVGLSRKSSTIKPLHPNFTSRIIHE